MCHLFGASIMLHLASPFQRKNELKQSPNQDKSWGVSGFHITI